MNYTPKAGVQIKNSHCLILIRPIMFNAYDQAVSVNCQRPTTGGEFMAIKVSL